MKANSTKGYVVLGILFALISIIAFAVPTLKTATFWIAYAFTAVAFVAQIGIWKNALGKEESLKSKFLGFPVIHIGVVYLAFQTVALVVFMFAPALPTWSVIVVCAIIAGTSAVCMIATNVGRNEIERVETKVQKKVFYIKELQTDVEMLASVESNSDAKAALVQLAERIRFSDPVSNERLADLEMQISAKVAELKTAKNKSEIILELILLLEERNKKCKALK